MFEGNPHFARSSILQYLSFFSSFLTIVLHFSQHPLLEIPILDTIQTFLCWPSLFECVATYLCLWACRYIETILGEKEFLVFLIYNLMTFLGPFLFVISVFGFRTHFSLFSFVPYSLYIFAFWRFPAVIAADPLTDKFIVSLSMVIVFLGRFPYSILTLLSSILGFMMWNIDFLGLRKFAAPVEEEEAVEASPLTLGVDE